MKFVYFAYLFNLVIITIFSFNLQNNKLNIVDKFINYRKNKTSSSLKESRFFDSMDNSQNTKIKEEVERLYEGMCYLKMHGYIYNLNQISYDDDQ